MFRSHIALAAGALVGILATPTHAQFDPAHNHLKCYAIRGQTVTGKYQLENQFGREIIFRLRPVLLCLPTQKICCNTASTAAGCQAVPCPADPVGPHAVDHFKCYALSVKQCTAADAICATPTPKVPKGITVNLLDQIHQELNVPVGRPKMLCLPVQKVRVDQTTSTTTTTTLIINTTTTTNPCRDTAATGQPPMCAGDCPPTPPGLACVFVGPAPGQCTCETPCAPTGPGACGGFCPNALQQCAPNAITQCGCCGLPGATCTVGTDCCSGTCMATHCQ